VSKANPAETQAVMVMIQPDGWTVDWETIDNITDASIAAKQQELFDSFINRPDQALFDLAFVDPAMLLTPSCQYLGTLSRLYIALVARRPEREFLREALQVELTPEDADGLLGQAPFMLGSEFLNLIWLNKIWQRLHRIYADEIQRFPGTVADYLAARHTAAPTAGRVFFHLVENRQSELPFAFMATYADGVNTAGQANHRPLANALREYRSEQSKLLNLLSTVHRAAELSQLIHGFLETGEIFQPLSLTAAEALLFLHEIPLYETSGIVCRMPDWWKKKSSTARVAVTIGSKEPSRVGLDALIDFNAEIVLGDLKMTAEEIRQLLAESQGLVMIKGRWIEVDHARLRAVLQAYDQACKQAGSAGLNLIEALRMQLQFTKESSETETGTVTEVSQGAWLQMFLKQMASTGTPAAEDISCGNHFLARLRPYQEQGLRWLHQMKTLGLGACLADDMGLGKTVQVIALLNGIRAAKSERSLLVVPASLIANWQQEIERFTPDLQLAILHPSGHNPDPADGDTLPEQFDLLVTTYGMIERYAWLKNVHWHNLILDEAQAIKNPATRQTRAAKQLTADFRIALTGTPVENRLSDLWSIFDFLNRGLLGSAREFSNLSKHLQTQQANYGKLKSVLSPFILRRLKTDRAIISDLPDKVEFKTYASLSKRQTVIYGNLVDELREKLASTSGGIDRKGLILASILKFKQICNHPDHYLGQNAFHETESGKLSRLREICETIYEKRERVLVFTQFREMAVPLQNFLQTVFDHQGLVLHGGTPVAKRRQIVESFQGSQYVPFLVLSIKAGGVGLNLTAANHVIHFDRWWNPAVENQATDRAFRIGQQKNVIVHKFITRGTIEEKIDQMIEDKSSLAREILPDKQEDWITEMDNQQLMALFQLST
jgi:superfamily II DNA or RNA helicase